MQEVRLIDANALKYYLCTNCDWHDTCSATCWAIRTIRLQETIEAEPVRHGRWENGECTNCKRNLLELCGGEDYELATYAEFDADFCPFCGARMDAIDTNVGGKGGDGNGTD